MGLMKNRVVNGVLYTLALVGSGVAKAKGWHGLEYASKPLLMLVLSSWFFFSSRRVGDRFTLMVQAGLFFSLIGDIATLFTHVDDFNFIIGMGAYFLAMLCYVVAFILNISEVPGMEGLLVAVLIAFGIGTYGFFYAWDLMPHVEEGLGPPVMAYVAGMVLMGMAAAFRFRRTFPNSFWLVMVGVLLLIASDSILAWDRFRQPLKWAPLAVLASYAVGQVLVAGGALAHVLDADNLRRREAMST